ncbi:MAG: S-methyl-5-thioribose-1-phosphate isomerase [Actinobacteria bacterium]|nr:S-methyl-5-thioribose-1-phosphate isomerase [Actinomycetota bacterium]
MKQQSNVQTLIWDGRILKLIDQRKLPFIKEYVVCDSYEKAGAAIKDMLVRGAPAIGVTAAYGVALAAIGYRGSHKQQDFSEFIEKAISFLAASRPTAVNLFWALKRMKEVLYENRQLEVAEIIQKLTDEAKQIEAEDININKKIGENAIEAFRDFRDKIKILTHCNAGALATAGYGTALGVIRSLASGGKIQHVVVDETRPYLQGARLTAWELEQEKIPFFIITDNMAAYMMSKGEVDGIVVGADRIAANGDAANKIGTLGVSILAKYYGIPFFVAAPLSTIDINIADGSQIPIEERNGSEVREVLGKRIISEEMPVRNPSFDVTPAKNITAIITEKGVLRPPFDVNIGKLFDEQNK